MPSPSDPRGLSRRDMLTRLFSPVRRAAAAATQPDRPAPAPANSSRRSLVTRPALSPEGPVTEYSHIAVIAGRECLAYQGTGCTICVERCPVAGALVLEQGLPRVVASICTGCRLCHEVCPAPGQAIRIVPRPPGLPPPVPGSTAPARSPFPVFNPPTPFAHG
ncbi:MAG: hypothetical protein IPL39_13240 [Opitutaceae bacterium]|nr:hypothetical protein [Opitutaceae bacterium]